jgi:hypothetical protein
LDEKMTNWEAALPLLPLPPQVFPGPPDNIAALQCWLLEHLAGTSFPRFKTLFRRPFVFINSRSAHSRALVQLIQNVNTNGIA